MPWDWGPWVSGHGWELTYMNYHPAPPSPQQITNLKRDLMKEKEEAETENPEEKYPSKLEEEILHQFKLGIVQILIWISLARSVFS